MTSHQLAKEVRKHVTADKVGVRNDGTVVVRHSYFYRHDNTAEKYAASVITQLAASGITCRLITAEDEFAHWPKTSYFAASLRPETPVSADDARRAENRQAVSDLYTAAAAARASH